MTDDIKISARIMNYLRHRDRYGMGACDVETLVLVIYNVFREDKKYHSKRNIINKILKRMVDTGLVGIDHYGSNGEAYYKVI